MSCGMRLHAQQRIHARRQPALLTEAPCCCRCCRRVAATHAPAVTCHVPCYSTQEAEASNVPPPKYSTKEEMAYTVMDFLFASQVRARYVAVVVFFFVAVLAHLPFESALHARPS